MRKKLNQEILVGKQFIPGSGISKYIYINTCDFYNYNDKNNNIYENLLKYIPANGEFYCEIFEYLISNYYLYTKKIYTNNNEFSLSINNIIKSNIRFKLNNRYINSDEFIDYCKSIEIKILDEYYDY